MKFTDIHGLDWPALVQPGDRIACSHMTAEPVALLKALAASRAHGGAYEIALGVPFSDAASTFPAATAFMTFGGMGTAGAVTTAGGPNRMKYVSAIFVGDADRTGAPMSDGELRRLRLASDDIATSATNV